MPPDSSPDGHTALLTRDPEPVTPFMHAGFRSAVTKVMAELFNHQTLVVVTGGAGFGKTLLLREVGRVLRAAEWHTVDEMHVTSLLQRPPSRPTAVLIDGAGRISPSQMQYLLRLNNLAVVLALPDQPELRIPFCAPIRLKPMSADASAQFIKTWLQQTGTRPDLFSREGIARLIELSEGIPRHLASLLQELAKHANPLMNSLSRADVDQAAQRLGLTVDPAPPFKQTSSTPPTPFNPDPSSGSTPRIASRSLERDSGQGSTLGFRRFLPENPGTAALTGLLCGIGAAIIGLLLQDWLAASRDDAAENKAAFTTTSPTATDPAPSGPPPSASPPGTPTTVRRGAP